MYLYVHNIFLSLNVQASLERHFIDNHFPSLCEHSASGLQRNRGDGQAIICPFIHFRHVCRVWLHLCKPQSLICQVELRVPNTDEYISPNPQRVNIGRHECTHYAANALRLSAFRLLEIIILRFHLQVLLPECDSLLTK